MRSLKRTSEQGYRGYDAEAGSEVAVEAGAVCTVSDSKAEQLLVDFPDEWEPAQSGDGVMTGPQAETKRVKR